MFSIHLSERESHMTLHGAYFRADMHELDRQWFDTCDSWANWLFVLGVMGSRFTHVNEHKKASGNSYLRAKPSHNKSKESHR